MREITVIRKDDNAKFIIEKNNDNKYSIVRIYSYFKTDCIYCDFVGCYFNNSFDSLVHAYIFLKENIEKLI